MLKLYTFNISHFAEKARWTLDYEGIPFDEQVLLPGPHQLVTRRIGKRTHVPVLEHDGRYVQGRVQSSTTSPITSAAPSSLRSIRQSGRVRSNSKRRLTRYSAAVCNK